MPTETKGKTLPLVCDWKTGLCMIAQVCMNHQKGTDRELMETASKMGEQVDRICKHYTETVDALNEAIELLVSSRLNEKPMDPVLSASAHARNLLNSKITEFLAKHNEVEVDNAQAT